MTRKQIIIRNIRHYWRYCLLIMLAVALTNTVTTGSLLVGDSVRLTLVNRVDERLGSTLTLITSGNGFMDETFTDTPALKDAAAAVFFTDGFVPAGASLLPVSVWGVDSSLAAVSSQGFVVPEAGEVVINRKVANELSLKEGDDLVVRLPNTRMIPSGSLFVTDNYTTGLRLQVKAVVDSRQSGNLNLRNEQSLPFNLFINRQELTAEMEMYGKCNIIMLNRKLTQDELTDSWHPGFSGIRVEPIDSNCSEIVSEGVFLDRDLLAKLDRHFVKPNRLFSYLVNDIAADGCFGADSSTGNAIPYSFVTAIDRFAGIELAENDIVLSDYAAGRLNAAAGDTVTLAFFVSAELKTLSVQKHSFVVRSVMPLQAFHADGRLSANFPGLSGVENCTDWNSDLPIDMKRITAEDENYWDQYRTAPKALIAYQTGAALWGNSYGVATAVRISGDRNTTLDEILSPADAGIMITAPRDAGLAAARGGVDFKSLFLSLAFFVIAAALLLAAIPLGGMLHDRRSELLLLQSLGFTQRRIHAMLAGELAAMTVAAVLTGVITAVLYNRLVLYALGNIWNGAVHTENFTAGAEPASLIAGSIASTVICLATVWLVLRRILKNTAHGTPHAAHGSASAKAKAWLPVICMAIMTALLAANIAAAQSPVLFVATGVAGLAAAVSGYAFLVECKASRSRVFSRNVMVCKNLNYRRRSGMISATVLASGLFVVFTVGLNRKNFADTDSLVAGTGGFALWGENTVPLYHSLSSSEGRRRFGLDGLPAAISIQQLYRHGGDDASCLNLNKSPQPAVLGVDASLLQHAQFTFAASTGTENVWNRLAQMQGDRYPVIADQTVLQWGLMKSVGDTIRYLNRRGEPVVLQFIGGLNTSVFQGNLIMDKAFFTEIWGGENGSSVMLVQTPDTAQHQVKQLLSQALAAYGLRLDACSERLQEFNSVTDSYLTIFLMLGSLGLLLGLSGMFLHIRRGLLNRAAEVSVLSAMGFSARLIRRQMFREVMTVPLYAVAAGTLTPLIAVASSISAVSAFTWAVMLSTVSALVALAWWYASRICNGKSFLPLALNPPEGELLHPSHPLNPPEGEPGASST